jgi:large subunit ribosomal protein L37e
LLTVAPQGQRHNKLHVPCRRCGRTAFHIQRSRCASCAYPETGMRRYGWSMKALRRRTDGTGRSAHLKTMPRRFKNGFREGTQAKKMKASA